MVNMGIFCMMGSMLLVTLSQTVLMGGWAIAVSFIAVVLGIPSGCLYALSSQNRR
jgi:hypothetical protein